MKLVCAPKDYDFTDGTDVLDIVLYGTSDRPTRGALGGAILERIVRHNMHPSPKAWDFLSLALAVMAADLAGHRSKSSDGWTRQFEIEVAVADPAFWNGQQHLVAQMLGFLTTDIWSVTFIHGGLAPRPPRKPALPPEDCVALLSGGLDSLIGNLDLVAAGRRPLAVSQTVRGDAENQRLFAALIGGGLGHLQMNHNANIPDPETPPTQRARSIVFLGYGVLAATTLRRYHADEAVTLYVCENGFISINPPLTPARLGSLSTRTTHPVFLATVQTLLDRAGLRVHLENPYQLKTKGEMLRECADRTFLQAHATVTTSCGRFLQHGYRHCGRCVPCLVRRAAFRAAGMNDGTEYVYSDLGRDDGDHAGFDDVRSVAMAIAEVSANGFEAWLGAALSTALLGDVAQLEAMVVRGLAELEALFQLHGVR